MNVLDWIIILIVAALLVLAFRIYRKSGSCSLSCGGCEGCAAKGNRSCRNCAMMKSGLQTSEEKPTDAG